MINREIKQTLKALVNTPIMPLGMYSQDCRDERHYGKCSQCDCWCHMRAKLDTIKDLLDGLNVSCSVAQDIDRILKG